jgi:hypothetical protein
MSENNAQAIERAGPEGERVKKLKTIDVEVRRLDWPSRSASIAGEWDGPLIEEPGLYYNLSARHYHADPCPLPSLSSGVARTIAGQSLMHAHLEHPRLGGKGRESTPAMNTGALVHALLSGNDDEFEIATYDSFRGKAAQEWRAGVEAAGRVAVLEKDLDAANEIVAAIRAKAALGCDNTPFAGHGKSEVSAVWRGRGGVWCRARFDRLVVDPGGFADIWDWKVTADASLDAIERGIIANGYHIQAAMYMAGLEALLPDYAHRVSFMFVFAESHAPFTVRRVCLDKTFLSIGRMVFERSFDAWARALETGNWEPEAAATIHLEPPAWYLRKAEGGEL